MSPRRDTVHFEKSRIDSAVSQAYARLAGTPLAQAAFAELLQTARERSDRVFDAPSVDGSHPGINALVNLAHASRAHVRSPLSWPGCPASWQGVIAALAQHLIALYPVPAFLGAAWWAGDGLGNQKRRWYLAHAGGASFRTLDIPIRMSRRMEDVFLHSPRHFGIETAMRRAELLGLGADRTLVDAILATRCGTNLSHGDFWRTFWHFLLTHDRQIDRNQIGPMVDFLESIRHERVGVETADGLVWRDPPEPDFSLRGRTPRSLLRLMDEWHRGLGLQTGGRSWERTRLRPMTLEVPSDDPAAPRQSWELTELTSSAQLRAEGAALRHCVASYEYRCCWGHSSIWSLRRRFDHAVRPIATIEVDPRRPAIVQVRGFRNRRPSSRALRIIQAWAARERLRLMI